MSNIVHRGELKLRQLGGEYTPEYIMLRVRDVLAAMSGYSAEDLEKIKQYCELLLSNAAVNSSDDWLLDAILDEVKARGLSYTIPDYFKIRNQRSYQGYARKSRNIRDCFVEALGEVRQIQLVSIGRRVAGLLADYLEPTHDLSLDIMLNHIDQIPQAIEHAFPGYIQSGLLNMLLRPAREWRD